MRGVIITRPLPTHLDPPAKLVFVLCAQGAEEETTGDSHNKKLPAGGFGAPGEYLRWLEADLAAANASRATRPWIVAGSHRPFAELNASHGALFAKCAVARCRACLRMPSPKIWPPAFSII